MRLGKPSVTFKWWGSVRFTGCMRCSPAGTSFGVPSFGPQGMCVNLLTLFFPEPVWRVLATSLVAGPESKLNQGLIPFGLSLDFRPSLAMRSGRPDGGPLLYRFMYRAPSGARMRCQSLGGKILEGNPQYSV